MHRTSGGWYYIVESEGQRVLRVDSLGKFLSAFRLRQRVHFTGLTADTLYIGDQQSSEVTLYLPNGAVARSLRLQHTVAPSPFYRYSAVQLFANNTFLATPVVSSDILSLGNDFALPLVRLSNEGLPRIRLGATSSGNRAMHVSTPGGEAVVWFRGGLEEFASNTLYALMHDRMSVVFVSRPTEVVNGQVNFQLLRIDHSGDTLLRREISQLAVSVPAAYRDSVLASYVPGLMKYSGTESAAKRMLETGLNIGRVFAPVSKVVVGADGTLWLRQSPRSNGRVNWAVYRETGEFVGLVELPWSAHLVFAEQGSAWAVRMEPDGRRFLDLYRTSSSSGGRVR
jgi:hypothetical protein